VGDCDLGSPELVPDPSREGINKSTRQFSEDDAKVLIAEDALEAARNPSASDQYKKCQNFVLTGEYGKDVSD
jgi:hypothetical protein